MTKKTLFCAWFALGLAAAAVPLWLAARDACSKAFVEHDGAVAELKRLAIKQSCRAGAVSTTWIRRV